MPETWLLGLLGIASNVVNKGKSAIHLLSNGLQVLSSATDKAKLFTENFSKNSDRLFPSKTNHKLHKKEGFKKESLWPHFMNGVQQSQGYKATRKRQFTFYH